jgi:hypothetical protein
MTTNNNGGISPDALNAVLAPDPYYEARRRKGWLTADEFNAKMEADPVYMAKKREHDRKHAEEVARITAEVSLLQAELEAAGFVIRSVADMYKYEKTPQYKLAIPILVRHLQMPYSDKPRSGIAYALACRAAKEAWPVLVAEYKKAPIGVDEDGIHLGAKEALACALDATVTRETLGELIELARDRSHGVSRILLLGSIKRSKSEAAQKAIEELASDPDLAKEIGSWRSRKPKV